MAWLATVARSRDKGKGEGKERRRTVLELQGRTCELCQGREQDSRTGDKISILFDGHWQEVHKTYPPLHNDPPKKRIHSSPRISPSGIVPTARAE